MGGYSPFWVSLAEFRAHSPGSFGFVPRSRSTPHRILHGSMLSPWKELLVLADSRFTGEAPVHQETYDWLQPGGGRGVPPVYSSEAKSHNTTFV